VTSEHWSVLRACGNHPHPPPPRSSGIMGLAKVLTYLTHMCAIYTVCFDRAVIRGGGSERQPPSFPPRLFGKFLFFAHLLIFVSLLNCFAWGQERSIRSGYRLWERRILVKNEIPTKFITRRISIGNRETVMDVGSQFIAIVKHPHHHWLNTVRLQKGKVLLRNLSEGGSIDRISGDDSAFTLLRNTWIGISAFNDRSTHVIKRVCIQDAARLLVNSCWVCNEICAKGSPRQFGWDMAAVMEIEDQFNILFQILGTYESGYYSFLCSNGDVSLLRNVQRILGNFPLLFRVPNVYKSEHNNCQRGDCLNAAIVLIKKPKWVVSDYLPNSADHVPDCYGWPHYVAGIISFLGGIFFLVFAGNCWDAAGSRKDFIRFGLFLLGIACLWFSFRLVVHSFDLIEFKVYPCAFSFSSPYSSFALSTHLCDSYLIGTINGVTLGI
jgi:hypothetical protein